MDATPSANQRPPVILLVYANDRIDPSQHLRNLSDEIHRIRDALKAAEQAGLCQVLHEANATADQIFSVFQDPRYRDRIAIFHYAGHADGYRLLLESASGAVGPVQAEGLAGFLGQQRGLRLVFLNGCSTAPQVQGLLDANCPAVIATIQAIDDQVAMAFAARFYEGLAAGDTTLHSAFKEADGAVRATWSEKLRGLSWGHGTEPKAPEDGPWALYPRSGAGEEAHDWTLRGVAQDPLFGLPELPADIELPQSGPFLNLNWFDRKHALVFFGRAAKIRELYDLITDPNSSPILLVYGQSGVGKSSLLEAGLLPRLEADYEVRYKRRDLNHRLLDTLQQSLNPGVDGDGLEKAWRQTEEAKGKPLLLVLDQVEGVFTQPATDGVDELGVFVESLQRVFGQPDTRPRGRLILSFRKEWLAEIEKRLSERGLTWESLFLEGLSRDGVVDAVTGATRSDRLRRKYRLKIEDGLAVEIADGLRADPQSPVAPTLQILLSKLWEEAKGQNREHPEFSRALYHKLRKKGILLGDFLDQQLTSLKECIGDVRSGLALDLLAVHTTPRGTAGQWNEADLLDHYHHVKGNISELVQRLKAGFVLADISSEQEPIKGSRLAHDTLAPLVRERFEKSDRPGQRARRVLENRGVDWQGGKTGAVLDESDLKTVEDGDKGMRRWDEDERRLIDASRQARNKRERAQRIGRGVSVVAVLLIVGAGVFSFGQWQQAKEQTIEAQRQEGIAKQQKIEAQRQEGIANQQSRQAEEQKIEAQRQERLAIARLQASEARAVADRSPQRALLLAAEAVMRPLEHGDTQLGSVETRLRELLGSFGGITKYSGGPVRSLAFDPSGRWLATGGDDDITRLWDLKDQAAEAPVPPVDGMIEITAFDPQGRWLATVVDDGTLRLWDLKDPAAEPRKLPGDESEITTLAFDPQGRWLATGSFDATPRLWDLKDPAAEPRMLRGHKGAVRTLAFDPQGRWLATGDEDGTVRLWQLDIRALLDKACQTAGRNLTLEEWRQHVGEIPYQVTCPQFPSGEALAKNKP